MKVAVVYNRDSKNVINLFGRPNQEKIGLKTIKRIVESLKHYNHQAIAFEGDKELIEKLEEFMPRVLKGERPGLVFNVSYGIQGEARYTHVPGMLEMVGIPYVGSNPLAHSLALDKVVSKMIFKQSGVPTPEFSVLNEPGFEAPKIAYPLIVKPKNEAVSFGIKVVHNEKDLREAAQAIFERFAQPVLCEQYIDGREVNVGLLGNQPPQALPPAELLFGAGQKIYTYEDKTQRSGREVGLKIPADLPPELTARAQDIARRAFKALGLYDCARVDMRLDKDNNFWVLEINSLPSLGEHGSYTHAAEAAGLDYAALVNRLVEVASARYFGTPKPPELAASGDPQQAVFSFITSHRDAMEQRLRDWSAVYSRTSDLVGLTEVRKELSELMEQLRLRPVKALTNDRSVWTWETMQGLKDGTLLVAHMDTPLPPEAPLQVFRRDPEWLYGEGIGSSRAPLVMMQYALRALRQLRLLRKRRVGVLLYSDEGRETRYSAPLIREAAAQARQVLVLRPANVSGKFLMQRRGQRKYALVVQGEPRRLGQNPEKPGTVLWFADKLKAIAQLSSRKDHLAVSAGRVETENFPMLLPHRIKATLLMSYLDAKKADAAEQKIRAILGKDHLQWDLEQLSDRPPMNERRVNQRLLERVRGIAQRWELPSEAESSLWPSVAGLVSGKTAVLCGAGPVAKDLYTPHEAVQRISLVQRTLLLSLFLLAQEEA